VVVKYKDNKRRIRKGLSCDVGDWAAATDSSFPACGTAVGDKPEARVWSLKTILQISFPTSNFKGGILATNQIISLRKERCRREGGQEKGRLTELLIVRSDEGRGHA
jgi:hypothetical protein